MSSDQMLSVFRRQGRNYAQYSPSGSDYPRLEVVRLLAGHTQRVAEVVVALRGGEVSLVSPEQMHVLCAPSGLLTLTSC